VSRPSPRGNSKPTRSDAAADEQPTLPRQPDPGGGAAPATGASLPEGDTLTPQAGAAPADVPPPLVDHPRYRVVGLLGRGGMGAVYRAEHRLMQRQVALKVINPSLTTSADSVERFRREVVAAARLTHPNIVAAYDAEQAGDLHFLVMELVEGMSLNALVQRRGRLSVTDACRCVRQAALGLQHAHEQGMVHRDIKPHNLMLTPKGQVKILDFGLARFVSETSRAAGDLTQAGTVMGTPDYMAPEQAQDPRAADIRADIYSLGCTLYHLLTGQRPFPEGDSLNKVIAHIQRAPRPVAELRPDVPAELCGVVERMLAKDKDQRFQTPAEVAAALAPFTRQQRAPEGERTQADPPPAPPARPPAPAPTRRLRPWMAAVLLLPLAVVAGGVAAVALRRSNPDKEAALVTSPTPPAATAKEPPAPPPEPPSTGRRADPTPATAKAAPPRRGPVQAPDMSKVKPLVRYDLRDRRSGWPVGTGRLGVERGYANGRYFLKATGKVDFFEGRGDRFPSCACELVGRVKSPGLAAWGLVLNHGTRDGHRQVAWATINRRGLQVFTREVQGDQVEVPQAAALTPTSLNPADEWNRLLVVFRDRRLEVYVNGVGVGEPVPVPADLKPANVAIGARFGPRGGEVEFERLTVWPADGLPTMGPGGK
jgi:hypothetical protein